MGVWCRGVESHQNLSGKISRHYLKYSMDADVVVTDCEIECADETEIIREYDFEKIRALMEDAK